MRKKLNEIEKIKEKYGSKKGSLPKADRMSLVHDCEYVGERIPFYNTPAEEEEAGGNDEEGGKKKKKEKKLAFPNKKAVWHRDPAWGIYKPIAKNEEVKERVKEIETTKNENIMRKFEERKVNMTEDVMEAYNKNARWKKLYYEYHQPAKPTDQYNTWKEANANPAYPGPQQYFKTPSQTFQKKKKKKDDEEEAAANEDPDKKIFYSDRKKIDKKIYKPMKTHIF